MKIESFALMPFSRLCNWCAHEFSSSLAYDIRQKKLDLIFISDTQFFCAYRWGRQILSDLIRYKQLSASFMHWNVFKANDISIIKFVRILRSRIPPKLLNCHKFIAFPTCLRRNISICVPRKNKVFNFPNILLRRKIFLFLIADNSKLLRLATWKFSSNRKL
jgi:hypothetical protein